MATNPITTEDLTISFSELLKIPVGDRVQAAMLSPDYQNALLNALTPIQMAKAFPDYYRRELPDISNFILGNRYLDDKGAAAFDQKGGGDYGEDKPLYDGKSKTPPPPKTVVDTILESARIYETTGQTGVTSAIKDTDEDKIMSTADVSLSPQERALLDTLAIGNPNETGHWESPSYNTIVGGKKFESFADHPGIFGLGNSSAAGRYQFTKTTWDLVVDKYNKENPDNPIKDFSPLNQDRAALWLAKDDYKRRTGGRDLMEDLNSPPENFGELIKAGLGGIGTNTTWEILQKRNAFEIEKAFNENLARNTEYAKQEVEAAAKAEAKEDTKISDELRDILKLDSTAEKYFISDNPETGKKLQKALDDGTITKDKLKSLVSRSAGNVENIVGSDLLKMPVGGSMSGKSIFDGTDVPYSGGAPGSRSFGGPREGGAKRHTGVDIPGQVGDPVLAVQDGTIRQIYKSSSGYGYVMDVEYPDGTIHRMAHLGTDIGGENSAFAKKPDGTEYKAGDKITAGTTIAYLGESGNAGYEFPHVHYEVIKKDYYENSKGRPPGREASMESLEAGRIDPRDWYKQQYENFVKSAGSSVEVAVPTATAVPTETAVSETTSQRLFIGDSIAEGMKDAAKGEGNTQVGRKPHEVLSEMERMGADYFKGKEVILSTGLSNNTQDLDSVKKQMEFLKTAGAKVKIAGMSNSREDLAPGNQQLQQLSSEYGYDFMGGYEAGKDKVHPTNYGDYLALATPKEEVPAYQYGGKPETQDDENLSVYDDTGNLRFKMNSGEGIYVKPEANEYADNKIDELSNRLDEVSNSFSANQPQQNRPKSDARHPWADKVVAADRPRSPSADRANRRTKFLNEGWRAGGWGSPNSITS